MRFRVSAAVAVAVLCICTVASAQYDAAWTRIYHMPGGTLDQPKEVLADDSGYIYVAATSTHPTRDEDVVLLKYDTSGATIGQVTFNGSADSSDVAVGLDVDDSGQAYVVGYTYSGPTTGFDYLLVKHDAIGDVLWSRTFDAGTDNVDYGREVKITAAGNILVLGQSWDGSVLSIGLVEYTPGGTLVWNKTFHWPTTQADNPSSMDCDSLGNIYMCASSLVSLNDNILTVKFDPDGDTLWARQYDGPAGGADMPVKIAVSPDGNVYVAGHSAGIGTFSDIVLLKYDAQGNLEWDRRTNGSADTADFASDLVLDPDGNPCVSGTWMEGETYYDGVVFKYFPDGTLDWLNEGYAYGFEYDDFTGIAVNAMGEVFATGTSRNIAGSTNQMYTGGYASTTGSNDWALHYNSDSGSSYGTDVSFDPTGNLYVLGRTYSGAATGWDIVTIKYSPSASGIKELSQGDLPRDFVLHQNYPNPFNAGTSIRFDIPTGGPIELAIFNVLGQRVRTFIEHDLPAGSYVLNWDGRNEAGRAVASGTYLYRLASPQNQRSMKMTLLK